MKNAGAGAWTPMIIFFLIIFSSTINAQQGTLTKRPNVPINSNCNGYLEYLPYNYANTTQKYPLLIYINGIGSTGDGSLTALDNLFFRWWISPGTTKGRDLAGCIYRKWPIPPTPGNHSAVR